MLLSEFNDFPQLPGTNSYDSCLRAIDQSDYFVLFIGGRVGGWYDQANQVSITRMEYRHADERFKQGHLRLLVFVRKEIWDVREDRQALKNFLEVEASLDIELSLESKAKLISHPSKFLNDAEFTIDFIQEVGRIGEMKQAVKRTGPFPGGNWIYQFASFRDVIDACRTVLDLSGSLRQKALRANLKYEIKSILAELLEPTDQGVQPVTCRSQFARSSFHGKLNDQSSYTEDHVLWLGMFLITNGNVGKRLKVTALQEAMTSGEFLDFDKASGTHTVGSLQQALFQLDGQIDRLRNVFTKEVWEVATQLLSNQSFKNNRKTKFSIKNGTLIMPFAVHDLIENVITLCRAIHLSLEGNDNSLNEIRLHPSSPLRDESKKIENERVSIEDVQDWLSTV